MGAAKRIMGGAKGKGKTFSHAPQTRGGLTPPDGDWGQKRMKRTDGETIS